MSAPTTTSEPCSPAAAPLAAPRPHRARLAALSLALVGLVLAALQLIGVPVAAASGSSLSGQMLAQTNSSRGQAGLPPLSVSGQLSSVAAGWAAHLAASGVLAHNPGLSGSVSGWTLIGENVAQSLASQGPAGAEALFMGSSAHRANILDPRYTSVGIGVVASGPYLWVVVDFMATGSTAPVPPPVTQPPAPPAAPPVTHAPSTVQVSHAPTTQSSAAARTVAATKPNRSTVRTVAPKAKPVERTVRRPNRLVQMDAAELARDDASAPVITAEAPSVLAARGSGRSSAGLALWLLIIVLALTPAVLRVRRQS